MLVKNGRVPGFKISLIRDYALDVFLWEGIQTLIRENKMLGARVHWPVDEKTAVVDINPTLVDY